MYTIKQKPQDFIVKEINALEVLETGSHIICQLKKKGRTTQQCVQEIAKKLNTKKRNIGYAGTKDKQAITEQYISIKNRKGLKEKIKRITLNNIDLQVIGYTKEPISLGDLEKNEFTITIRNLTGKENINVPKKIPNYFDDQRFGQKNVEIGKYLLKKDFKAAANSINECFNKSSKRIVQHLHHNKNDYIGAIQKSIPKKIMMMYIHAVQSLLFNRTVSEFIKKHSQQTKKAAYKHGTLLFTDERMKNRKVPLPGFNTTLEKNEIDELMTKKMEEEQINTRDFIIPQIPFLTSEGTERNMFVEVEKWYESEFVEDELNSGKKKITCSFSLPPGSYATIVIKSLFAK